MTDAAEIVVPCPRGTEALLAAELAPLGVEAPAAEHGFVRGRASYEAALRVCLWSRVASRVLWPLAAVDAADPDGLYAALRELPIEEHLDLGRSFAIDLTLGGGTAAAFPHSQYAMLRCKDAIVDRLRDRRGARPDVDRDRPDLRLSVHVAHGRASISIDLAGEALHRRAYRSEGRAAPLKENLAAALLLALDWPARAGRGEPFCDPMCGSGTLPIEAALIVGDRAPGLLRPRWGFSGWRHHDERVWAPLMSEARARARAGLRALDEATLLGYDADGEAVAAAGRNAEIAGLRERVRFATAALDQLTAPDGAGLLLTNPPYGERLGDEDALPGLYRQLGDVLRRRFPGWTAGVLTAHGPLPGAIGLRPSKKTILFNGAIECRLLELPISSVRVASEEGPGWRKPSAASEQFMNRLAKNLRHLGKWARREGVSCFRAYDADLPEYAVAVDVYEGRAEADPTGATQRWAHVQEYAAPATIEPQVAQKRLSDVLARTAQVLEVPPEQVIEKLRRRQRPDEQYQASGRGGSRLIVEEGGHRFLVNLHDYLDTGLFLDQRLLRRQVAESSRGRDFLNLFSYTGSASVYAAAAGARSTTSVDLSNTYLAWAEDNFRLNGLPTGPHRLVQADCVQWLAHAAAGSERWGTILLAPPTFSNSKRMAGTLDLQRDHAALLSACARLLAPDGAIYFVNHFRRFKMAAPPELSALELTRKTLPPDFGRDARFHNAWRLVRR
jgi:23S rRNA (guanine2445-N2)-methyltransferase / 23S rRNA (guanine2069-N7)-methyltransferase